MLFMNPESKSKQLYLFYLFSFFFYDRKIQWNFTTQLERGKKKKQNELKSSLYIQNLNFLPC